MGLPAALAFLVALGPPASAAPPDLSGSVRLSDERTFTRWAYAAAVVPIREAPKPSAWPISPVSLTTPEGLPAVYTLLRGWTDPTGHGWVQVRVPIRPKPRIGWADATAFGEAHLIHTELVVDRRHLRAALYRGGRRVWRSPVGIGKPTTPTPGGHFWVTERIHSTIPRGPFGPWAFGTSAYSRLSEWPGGGVIGIHGTNRPQLIPGRPSHGCIRVPNPAIRKLARLMPIGTPVRIR
jgi:hypothetical protein